MKTKVFVFCICFFPVSSAFAQNWFIGGSFTLNFSDDEITTADDSINSRDSRIIDISPIVGYKINRLDFGIFPVFQFRQTENNNESGYIQNIKNFGIGTGIFSRYNFVSFGNFSILGKLSAEYLYSNSKMSGSTSQINYDQEDSSHAISMNLGPEFEFRLSDRFSLYSDFGIGGIRGTYKQYSSSANSSVSSSNRSTKGNSFSFDIPSVFNLRMTEFSLGFYVHFGK